MYVCKKWFRLLALIALITLTLPLAVDTRPAYGNDGDNQLSIPEKAEMKYPNLGSTLDQMAATVEEGEVSAREAAKDASVSQEESVAVTIYLSGNVDEVVKFLEANGGSPRNVGKDYIEAYVPVTLLGPVSERPGVIRVREIIPPQPAQSTPQIAGHGPQAHLSEPWNRAGYNGQGIKVGIIALGFEDFRGLMGTELPATVVARCYTDVGVYTQDLAACEVDSDYGTRVAEAVIDIAPGSSLYIAYPRSKGDLQAAADWMALQGVSVINSSVDWTFDGPGDGTSPYEVSPLKTVDRAVDSGIIWVSTAGSYARRSWFGPYSDRDSDGFIEFNRDGVELNKVVLSEGDVIRGQLRWEGVWGRETTDLDLILYDSEINPVWYSGDYQTGPLAGDFPIPWDYMRYEVPSDGDYYLAIWHDSGPVPDWIQLTVWGVGSIEHYTENGSISNPAESANPGMLAVGAAPWYDPHTIEWYSSRGPTPAGRVKPDIVGATCGETALRPLNENNRGFCGTGQATSHVAGMAALVRQRFPHFTPSRVAAYLKNNAAQRESPDPNNTWGHGFAQLPPPLTAVAGNGPQALGSPAWDLAGYHGEGVKVGIIDVGFEGFRGLMGIDLPTTAMARCYTDVGVFTQDLADCEVDSDHGTIVAESLIDTAPEVSLYIARPRSRGDLQATVDWMVSQGVSVINYSVSWTFDGPGDGNSPFSDSPLKTVDRAVNGGIIWVNSSGNYAVSNWFGSYSDANRNGYIEFGGYEINVMSLGNVLSLREEIGYVDIQLRWDDNWGSSTRDFDLFLVNAATGEIFLTSEDTQSGEAGHVPFEYLSIGYSGLFTGRELGVAVAHYGGSVPGWIQLVVRGDVGSIERHTESGSIVNPAESANPGMVAVGATPWYDTRTIEYYSSQGPAPDGRVKPDIVGATCGETALRPLNENSRGFCGTSQAAPHVAGIAALVRQAFPDYSPVQVANYLKDNAAQRESPDPNNTWGHGFAQLPSPLPPAAPTITTPITTGADWMTIAWAAPTDGGREAITSYDLRYIRSVSGETVESNWTVVADVGTPGSALQQHVLTGLTGSAPYGVQVRGVNIWGPGPWSATAIGTTAPTVAPGAPQYLTAGVAVDEARVDLSWTAPISSGGAPITGYKVESSDDGGDPWVEVYTTTGAATSYTDEGTDANGPTFGAGVMRHYRVSAINSVGTGPPSNVAIATPDACRDPLGLLTIPVTKTGVWANDCDSEGRAGGFARYYSFTLAESKQVEINLTSSVDSYLLLRQGEGRDGVVVVENDNVGSRNYNSSINRMLDAGAYTVQATTYFAGQTGGFTLSVRPLQETENLGTLAGSVDRSNSMWTSDYQSTQQGRGYARSYTFTLTAATHVVINLTSPKDPYLYVLRDGAVVHENDNVTDRNLNSRIDQTLQRGTYTIEATTYFPGQTGTFHLSIGYFGSSP